MSVRLDTKVREISQAEQPEAERQTHQPAPVFEPQLGPLTFVPQPVVSKADQPGAKNSLAVQTVSAQLAHGRLDRQRFQASLMAASASGFSASGEESFVAQLEKTFKEKSGASPQVVQDLAWAVAKTRAVLPSATSTPNLDAFLRARGFRLRTDAPLAPGPGFQLDRAAFKAALREANTTDPKRTDRLLASMVHNLADDADVFYAQRQITQAAKNGQLCAGAAQRVLSLLAPKMRGSVAIGDVADALRQMRKENFSAQSVERFKALLNANTSDDKVLFFAERVVKTALAGARQKPQHQDEATQARLNAAGAELATYLTQRTGGLFDRYGQTRLLRRMSTQGQLTPEQYGALRAAAVTSKTKADFAHGVLFVQQNYGLALSLNEVVYEARAEQARAFAQSLSNDIRDASGNIIETANEREQKRRLTERQRVAPKQEDARRVAAHAAAQINQALGAVEQARGPEEASAKQSDLNNAKAQQAEAMPKTGSR